MAHIRSFDHVGITVADLDMVTAFFVGLGLEVEGRTFLEGEFVDTVIGIPNSRSEIVTLRLPGGGTKLELSRFVRPEHEPGSVDAMSTELGLRNICFEVDDLQAIVDRLAHELAITKKPAIPTRYKSRTTAESTPTRAIVRDGRNTIPNMYTTLSSAPRPVR